MNEFKRFTTILLFIVFNYYNNNAQNIECGTSILHQEKMKSNTEYKDVFLANEAKVHAMRHNNHSMKASNTTYTIPIVVHIIHLGENSPSNISDDQVYEAINGLNDRFSGAYGDGVDMGVEFCLAQRDPNGFPTTGINRADGSDVPFYADLGIGWATNEGASPNAVKNLSIWPTTEYLNIWVVHYIAGNPAGYAPLPNGVINPYSGIVIQTNAMIYQSSTPAHEAGHFFGLKHTHEGAGEIPGATCADMLESDCETEGDCVCDTSPQRHSYGIEGIVNCGEVENPCIPNDEFWDNSVKNFMSYCSNNKTRFTEGQRVLFESYLLTDESRIPLLESDGCSPPQDLDAGISGYSPGCTQGGFNIILKNFGLEPLTEVVIHWEINGESGSFVWTGSLNSQEEEFVTINNSLLSQNTGVDILVSTSNPNGEVDLIPENDAYHISDFRLGLDGGNYTIGSDPTNDFQDFITPITIMNHGGICGPVVFNVKEGTYDEGGLTINDILGADAENTITFQSEDANNMATWSFSGSNTLLELLGTDFISFNHIIFDKSVSNGGNIIEMDGQVENIQFSGCTFYPSSSGSAVETRFSLELGSRNLSFIDNTFVGGYRALSLKGQMENTSIVENTCNNQNHFSFYLNKNDYFSIEHNIITGANTQIYLNNCKGTSFIRNNFLSSSNTVGILSNYNNFAFGEPLIISNNFIQGNEKGVEIAGGRNINVYFNTIQTSSSSEPTLEERNSNTGVNIQNNIIANFGGGYAIKANRFDASDYNDLYSSGTTLVNWNETDYDDLNTWQASGFDLNSVSELPIFISDTDLHLDYLENELLDNAGIPIASITTDYDGDERNPLTPDIGADEISGPVTISGVIHKEDSEGCADPSDSDFYISDVEVDITQANDPYCNEITDSNGYYECSVEPYNNYTITPHKDGDDRCGITTLDLIQIRKHILNVELIESPYRRIAANVDHDDEIDGFDVIEIKKLILGIIDEFPNSDSWFFVDAEYEFSDLDYIGSQPPTPDNYPNYTKIEIENISENSEENNFVGIKMGDIDCSSIDCSELENRDKIKIRGKIEYDDNGYVQIPIRMKNMEFNSFQMGFTFDPALYDFVSIHSAFLKGKGFSSESFRESEGNLSLLWYNEDINDVSFGKEHEYLFTLIFKKHDINTLPSDSDFNLNDNVLEGLFTQDDNSIYDIEFILDYDPKENEPPSVIQVSPNPASTYSTITVKGEKLKAGGSYTITDIYQKTVQEGTLNCDNECQIKLKSNVKDGIHSINIYSPEGKASGTKRIIITNKR